jgi:hypothetical protein
LVPLVGALLAAAGAGAGTGAQNVSRRDSADVEIVNVRAAALTAQQMLSATPIYELALNAVPGASGFSFVSLTASGGIRGLLTGTADVALFGPDGRYIRTTRTPESIANAGRAIPAFAQLCAADTIVVYEQVARTQKLFDGAGAFVTGSSLALNIDRSQTPYPLLSPRTFNDCTLLLNERPAAAAAGDGPDSLVFKRLSRDLSTATPIATLYTGPRSNTPAGILPVFRAGVVAVSGANIFAVDDRVPQIRIYSGSGSLVRIIRWDSPPIPAFAPADRSTISARSFVRLSFIVDEAQNMWIEEVRAADDERAHFLVLAVDGSVKGRYWMPSGSALRDVRAGRALISRTSGSLPTLSVHTLAAPR